MPLPRIGKIGSNMITLWPALRNAFPEYAITGYYDVLRDAGLVFFRHGSVRAEVERVVALEQIELETAKTTDELVALVKERFNNPTT